jgi:hypothetical protein
MPNFISLEPVLNAARQISSAEWFNTLVIDSHERLVSEIAAWERQRNSSRARIKWMFTTEKARAKMARAYPKLSAKES